MFWIIGGDAFFRSLAEVTNWGWARAWAAQLEHVEWAGFHFAASASRPWVTS